MAGGGIDEFHARLGVGLDHLRAQCLLEVDLAHIDVENLMRADFAADGGDFHLLKLRRIVTTQVGEDIGVDDRRRAVVHHIRHDLPIDVIGCLPN